MNRKKIILPLVALLLLSASIAFAVVQVLDPWTKIDALYGDPHDDIGVTGLGLFEVTYEHDIPQSPGQVDYFTPYHLVLIITATGEDMNDYDIFFEYVIQTSDPDGMWDTTHVNRFTSAFGVPSTTALTLGDSNGGWTALEAPDYAWTQVRGPLADPPISDPAHPEDYNGFKTTFMDETMGSLDVLYVPFKFSISPLAVGYPDYVFRLSFQLKGEEVVP